MIYITKLLACVGQPTWWLAQKKVIDVTDYWLVHPPQRTKSAESGVAEDVSRKGPKRDFIVCALVGCIYSRAQRVLWVWFTRLSGLKARREWRRRFLAKARRGIYI